MKNRWYSPTLGRFLTSDPIAENGGLNTQAYCHNDPINRVDPNGCYDWAQLWYDVKKTFDVFDVLQPEDSPQLARHLEELHQRKLNDKPDPILLAQTPIFLAPSASVCPAPLYPGQPTIGADPLTPAQRAEQQQRLRLEEMAAKEAQDIAIVNYYRTQDSVYAGCVAGVALAPRGIAPPAPSYSGGTFGGAPTVPGPILGGSPVSAPSTGAPFPTHSMRVRFVQTSGVENAINGARLNAQLVAEENLARVNLSRNVMIREPLTAGGGVRHAVLDTETRRVLIGNSATRTHVDVVQMYGLNPMNQSRFVGNFIKVQDGVPTWIKMSGTYSSGAPNLTFDFIRGAGIRVPNP